MVRVEVKWQKEVFKDVEVDTAQAPLVFKNQLFSLTGVPPERQKILGLKGGLLRDDAQWTTTGVKEGSKVTMLGTAGPIPEAPQQAPQFVEDLPEEERDAGGLAQYGAGLENLGNTCYMNSTLQCLYGIHDLRDCLEAFRAPPGSAAGEPDVALTLATKSLFSSLKGSVRPVAPMAFLLTLRKKYPQFAQQAREGYYMQQDAEECWSNVLYSLRGSIHGASAVRALEPAGPVAAETSAIEALLGVRLSARLVCSETGEAVEEASTAYSLKCNIDSNVNHLIEGLRLGLKEDRERTSSALGRLATFEGSSSITSLPPYLTVQMVRFFYKADVQQKAKILRKVTFPTVLDVGELCSPELQQALAPARSAADTALESEALASATPRERETVERAVAEGEGLTVEEEAALDQTEPAVSRPLRESVAGPLTGRYELCGVLTHKGRSADSGHYVAWVKQDDGSWIQFDDDEMHVKREEDVLALAGGGDWHMAYLLLYRAVRAPLTGPPKPGHTSGEHGEALPDEPMAQA